jgi:hypothetical protein
MMITVPTVIEVRTITGAKVELTAEREGHIREEHPDLLPSHLDWVRRALSEPNEVRRRSWRPDELMFLAPSRGSSRELTVVVVVEDEPAGGEDSGRLWIVTAYLTRTAPVSEVLWARR